eukprot:741512-Prorocentrum_minimum.AAC.1
MREFKRAPPCCSNASDVPASLIGGALITSIKHVALIKTRRATCWCSLLAKRWSRVWNTRICGNAWRSGSSRRWTWPPSESPEKNGPRIEPQGCLGAGEAEVKRSRTFGLGYEQPCVQPCQRVLKEVQG